MSPTEQKCIMPPRPRAEAFTMILWRTIRPDPMQYQAGTHRKKRFSVKNAHSILLCWRIIFIFTDFSGYLYNSIWSQIWSKLWSEHCFIHTGPVYWKKCSSLTYTTIIILPLCHTLGQLNAIHCLGATVLVMVLRGTIVNRTKYC